MYTNGIVIQRYVENQYKGIDGSGFSEHTGQNWYFNDDETLSQVFEPYYDEHIGMTYWNLEPHSWVAACNTMHYIYRYIEESKKRGIPYRLLLCESEIPRPVMKTPDCKRRFLGYDYAYAGGDNYSAVYNEIPFVFPEFQLNHNGLFQTEEAIRAYIMECERFKKNHAPGALEEGDFTIFRLHELFL